MRMNIALVLCLALVASGCATTSKVMLGPARQAIAPNQVRVYFSPPSSRYEEIAVLETSSGGLTYGEQNKMNEVIGKLRVAAASLGANGVLFQGAAEGYGRSNVGIGVGSARFGGRSHVGGGIGVDISPSQKHAAGIAVYVFNPPPVQSRRMVPAR